MDLSSWLDEEFYTTGCCFPLSGEGEILLAKGGEWLSTSDAEIKIQVRDFYGHQIRYYHPRVLRLTTLKELRSEFGIPSFDLILSHKTDYDHLFEKDYNSFLNANSDLKKAVLMSRVEYLVSDQMSLKRKALAKAIHSYIGDAYGFWFDGYAMIGTTPEILFEIEGKNILSYALAGTVLKENIDELTNSPKLRLEHDIVVANIMEDLLPFCETLERFETAPAYFGRLVHLKTMIQGEVKSEVQSDSLIKALSPTAALGGYPRLLAREFLDKSHYHLAFPDRYHGSIFSVQTPQKERAIVMIRNIQLHQERLIIEAGAGVVNASEQSAELKEIHHKISVTKELLL